MRLFLTPMVFACAMAAQHASAETPLERSNRLLKEVSEQMTRQSRSTALTDKAFPQPVTTVNPADIARQFSQSPLQVRPPATELMIFVSFSMPREALLRIVDQSEKSGARLIFRGFKGDKLTEMAQHIASLIGKHRVEALVHPPAFNQFKITQVPALVIAQTNSGEQMTDGCAQADQYRESREALRSHLPPTGEGWDEGTDRRNYLHVLGEKLRHVGYVKVTGDVSQDYALDYIERTSPQWATAARFFGDKLK